MTVSDREGTIASNRDASSGTRAGRRRDPEVEARALAGALELYAQAGWAGFSFDAVARRSSIGKAPLYLRWSSKEDLLMDALSTHVRDIPIAETGNLRADLVSYASYLIRDNAAPHGWALLRIHLEATVVPQLYARFSEQVLDPHIARATHLLTHAMARRELPAHTSTSLLLEAIYGAIIIKIILSSVEQRAELHDNPQPYAAAIVDLTLAGTRALTSRQNHRSRDNHQ